MVYGSTRENSVENLMENSVMISDGATNQTIDENVSAKEGAGSSSLDDLVVNYDVMPRAGASANITIDDDIWVHSGAENHIDENMINNEVASDVGGDLSSDGRVLTDHEWQSCCYSTK